MWLFGSATKLNFIGVVGKMALGSRPVGDVTDCVLGAPCGTVLYAMAAGCDTALWAGVAKVVVCATEYAGAASVFVGGATYAGAANKVVGAAT